LIGQKLGHYEISGVLGKGGMGEVFRARDTNLERDVALKILPPDIAGDPSRAARFRREALAVAALKHPNIVTLYSAEEAEGVQFLTMELVEGGTLRGAIDPHGVQLDRFFDLAIPLAQAISSAHEKGITHRDLKPANILLDEEGRPKVLDFGLAQMVESATPGDATAVLQPELTTDGTVVGTVGYMSPEQAEGRETDARSDIFSLGVILYELSTGVRPFEGDTNAQVLSSLLRDEPAPAGEVRTDLPHHLGRILRRCLAKKPADRYQTARDLYNELKDLREEVTLERHSGSARAPERRRSRAPLLVAAVAVVAVAALLLLRGRPSPPATSPDSGPIRIVVLPLQNLGNPEDEFFADGMTEELTNRLAAVDGLGVISRQSAQGYAGRNVPVQEIGQELGVQYLLAGTVRWAKSGEQTRVRISPQLIRVEDDTQLWSSAYDRTLEDVFAIQSEIAREVIRELGIALGGSAANELDAVPTANARAHELYMRAMAFRGTYEESQLSEMQRLLEIAVDADPGFARAWAQLAKTSALKVHFGIEVSQEAVDRSRHAAERALDLQPDAAFSHVAMGFFQYHALKDYSAAERAFARAAKITPNDPEMLRGLGLVQRRRGDWNASTRSFEAAMDLNPRDPGLVSDLLDQYVSGSIWPEAERMLASARELEESSSSSGTFGALIPLLRDGDLDAARAELDQAVDPTANWIAESYGIIEVCAGNYERALERIAAAQHPIFLSGAVSRTGAVWRGLVHQLAGNEAEARGNLEFAVGQLEDIIATRGDGFRYETALGVVLAALDRKDEARIHATRALEKFPLERDYVWGPALEMDVAQIHTMVGDLDAAMVHAERGLSWPCYWTPERIALDPWLKPLTTHPDYEAMTRRAAAHRASLFEGLD
jgi:non-specific serine/threonine protein kinase